MTQFESEIKTIEAGIVPVFDMLSDLNNLSQVKDKLPADKIKDMEFDRDSCSFSISPVGTVSIQVIEREPHKTIKFGSDKSPVAFFLWIQLIPVSDTQTKMKLTVKAELNPFIKGMVSKPLQEGLNKIAEVLASVHY